MFDNQKNDYLRYLRVIRSYYCMLHSITVAQFELLSYVSAEKFFTFNEVNKFYRTIFLGNNAFVDLLERKFIVIYSTYGKNEKGNPVKRGRPGRKKTEIVYTCSCKTNMMMNNVYAFIEKQKELYYGAPGSPLTRYRKNRRVEPTKALIDEMNEEIRKKKADESYKMPDINLDF